MDIEEIRLYCLSKKGASESLPFDETSPVYKVMNKIFLIMNLEPPFSINVKCDPEEAIELRGKYDTVLPGYHMNKHHWNTILVDKGLPNKLIMKWIDDSYNLIISNLPKKTQKEFAEL
jgi:predicted DNA-binding protein (MmcQ/YjbR family)